MPIYEYRCPKGHVFERFQRMSDPPPDACDDCGAGPVQVVLYPVAVHFKGPGFYTTDYGRGAAKKEGAERDGAGKADGGEKKGAEKTDKAPAAEKKAAEKKAAEA